MLSITLFDVQNKHGSGVGREFQLKIFMTGKLARHAPSDGWRGSGSALNASCLFVFILVVSHYSAYLPLEVLLSGNHNLSQRPKC